jgi:hypothetical protein
VTVTETVTVQGNWIPLLRNAEYGGGWESSTGYTPLAYGTFTMFKATYKSGFVSCATGIQSDYPWQRCIVDGYSFELKKNGAYVVESPSWEALPIECDVPGTPTGDIVCRKPLVLQQGDKLTPTWYEVSHRSSTEDNEGTIVIDLFGFSEVKIHS